MRVSSLIPLSLALSVVSVFAYPQHAPAARHRHNVIVFVADGLRRGSVTKEDMPTFYKLRTEGVDFANSHSVFPTFTTANASVIATGHGLGDTGDYSNTLYPGVWLAKPEVALAAGERPSGTIVPFIESDDLLANMNAAFHGNYLGERTLMSVVREQGYRVASVGKAGPVAIQQIEAVQWDGSGAATGTIANNGAIIVDDQTGQKVGVSLPPEILQALRAAKITPVAPSRNNGYVPKTPWDNGFSGEPQTPGTLAANFVQEQWFTDVTTEVLLPGFTETKKGEEAKPFLLLFWSRDPDGTQHNQGDSLQSIDTGINGETSRLALKNADECLKRLLDWLDRHPAVKAETDILVTSDHGFATVSRREIGNGDGEVATEPSTATVWEPGPNEDHPQKIGTLPPGFLALDLGIHMPVRFFDAGTRSSTGDSMYEELAVRTGDKRTRPAQGSVLLGTKSQALDGSDARLIVAGNGGSDLIYVPDGSAETVHETLDLLSQMDYIGGIFVDDKFCATPAACPGALPLSAIGLVGSSKVPRPAIVVSFKSFLRKPGDLQSTIQIADTTLQEGQGQHGGLSRAQTFNNMAAIGPDFRRGFVDTEPMGNVDIVPTLAKVLGIEMPSVGTLKGRVLTEALGTGKATAAPVPLTLLSAPAEGGVRTLLMYQEHDGVKYFDQSCMVTAETKVCP